MKKTLLIALLSIFSLVTFAQNEGPIKFLGIPIDGPKRQFEYKLRAKGFQYNPATESHRGQFNGKSVSVLVHANHNIVDRVYVAFPFTNEEDIRIEYNRLLKQFNDTGKYMDLSFNEEIPDDEDISYEIATNNKRYQASFSYYDASRDRIAFMNALLDNFTDFFTEEQLAKLKEYTVKAMDLPQDQQKALLDEMMAGMQKMGLGQDIDAEGDPEKALDYLVIFIDGMKSLADGEVWFMIDEFNGQYNIGLYYDNLHNQAHGEDL